MNLSELLINGTITDEDIQSYLEMQKDKVYLEQHKNKIWQGKDGFWRTHYGDDRKLLKRKDRESLERFLIEYYKPKMNTFKNRFDIWVDRQQKCGRSGNTIYKYQKDYERFFEGTDFENLPIDSITEEEISEHIMLKLSENPIPYKSLKSIFGYINGVFEKSIRDRIISDNCCKYVDLELFKQYCKESDKTDEERTLSNEERLELLNSLRNPKAVNANIVARKAVEFALYTGMRVGEISGLKWKQIDFNKGIITINSSEKQNRLTGEYSQSKTKNCKIRKFPITDEIKQVLDEVAFYEKKNGYFGEFVFQDQDGKLHANKISTCVRTHTLKFGEGKSIHAIRRTLNSNMRCNGVSSTVAASLLGHAARVNENNYTYDVEEMKLKKEMVTRAGKVTANKPEVL